MVDILHTGRIFAILMASGFSKRFGAENKLLVPFRGKPLARHTIDLVCGMACFSGIFLVYADEQVAALAGGLPVALVRNNAPERGQRESVRLGVAAAAIAQGDADIPGLDYYLFFPCDQPLLDAATVWAILEARRPGCIVEPRFQNRTGNPCLFSAVFKEELLSLGENAPPRDIKARHSDSLAGVDIANGSALADIDEPADLELLQRIT